MVEAGGVEPPSEKRYGPKPTCLAQFAVRSGPWGSAARSPAALRTSKKRSRLVRWFSPKHHGPRRPGQLTVRRLLPGPWAKPGETLRLS